MEHIISKLLETVRSLYDHRPVVRTDVDVDVVRKAQCVVSYLMPTCDCRETFTVLVALNLLNAIVKRPHGRKFTDYSFIKGQAARLFVHLVQQPQAYVQIYYDPAEQVAYFRAMGVQMSFHFLPMSTALRLAVRDNEAPAQTWDGLQLQTIAEELFAIGLNMMAQAGVMLPDSCPAPVLTFHELEKVKHHRQKAAQRRKKQTKQQKKNKKWRERCRRFFNEDKWLSLRWVFERNIWTLPQFELFDRSTHRPVRVIRYSGFNAHTLNAYLIDGHPAIPPRHECHLMAGQYYYISPQKHIWAITPAKRLLIQTRNTYVRMGHFHCNQFVTYSIALYLAQRFPSLRFVCAPNYNRLRNRRRFFTASALLRVPPGSVRRRLKLWLVVDAKNALHGFTPEMLPQALIDEYMKAEDYYGDYEIIKERGYYGLRAYRHFNLLPCRYASVLIWGQHAYVQHPLTGRWAIYALGLEHFMTFFVYDRIWYDRPSYRVLAEQGGKVVMLYDFFPEIHAVRHQPMS